MVTKKLVVHCKKEPYDVYIGRGGKWGNPFIIGRDGTREDVVRKYREYIMKKPELMNSLHELRGKILGCWCKPLSCHGDVLIDLVNKHAQEDSYDVFCHICAKPIEYTLFNKKPCCKNGHELKED